MSNYGYSLRSQARNAGPGASGDGNDQMGSSQGNSTITPISERPVLLGNVTGMTGGPLPSFPLFNGQSSELAIWAKESVELGEAFGHTPARVAALMVASLTGEAKLWWRANGKATDKESPEKLLEALQKEFGVKITPSNLRKQLQATINQGEDWTTIRSYVYTFEAVLVQDIKALSEEEVVEIFTQNLKNRELQLKLLEKTPKKFTDAKNIAMELVLQMKALAEFTKLNVSSASSSSSSTTHTVTSINQNMDSRLDRMERRLEGFMRVHSNSGNSRGDNSGNSRGDTSGNSRSDRGRGDSRNFKGNMYPKFQGGGDIPPRSGKFQGNCYKCGETGHLARDCHANTQPRERRARFGKVQSIQFDDGNEDETEQQGKAYTPEYRQKDFV